MKVKSQALMRMSKRYGKSIPVIKAMITGDTRVRKEYFALCNSINKNKQLIGHK